MKKTTLSESTFRAVGKHCIRPYTFGVSLPWRIALSYVLVQNSSFFSVFMDFGTCWCVFYWSPVPQLLTFRLSSDSVSFRTVPCLCFKACAKNVDSKGDTQVSFLNITMFVLIAFSTLLLLVLSAFFNITIFVRSAIFNVTFLYLVRFSTLLFLYLVHVQRYCFCT